MRKSVQLDTLPYSSVGHGRTIAGVNTVSELAITRIMDLVLKHLRRNYQYGFYRKSVTV